ncbi:hypothetical protein LCGC14_2287660, partial [marine sediment metagenome]
GLAIFALGVWLGTHLMLREVRKTLKELDNKDKLNEPNK